jgi:signal transduction histidine kinase
LQQIIATAIDRVQPLADTKKITITTHLPKSPVRIIGDEKKIEEVLVILVDNAIKYSNESSKVSVSCEVRQKQAVLSVKDNGIGISKEDISHIFDRFYRADTSRTNQHTSGHGLGLAIAKDIVEKHKGTIVASSIQSKGSTFTITLPIA